MSDEIKIEKGIKIPAGRAAGITATLREMKPGDSFVTKISRQANIHTSARQCGVKIVTRRLSDSEIRVWKVK